MRNMRWLACASVVGLAATPAMGQTVDGQANDEGAVQAGDAIVVTGTLLQRSDYQISSPIDVVGRASLEATAPATIAEFIKDLPYNFGSAFASGRAFGNERGGGTINLRGLGAAATLVLINGQRMTQLPDAPDAVVDVNSLVPEIMLERLEILKDGASATYGSDAIAGVVNFITNDRFEGVRLSSRINQFTYSNATDYRIEAMIGSSIGERTHVIAAFGFYDQQPINSYAENTQSQRGTGSDPRFSSASSNPGEFIVPTRNADGLISGQRTNVVDPLCGTVPSSLASPGGLVVVSDPALARDCRYQFWHDNGSQSDIRRYHGMARARSELTDAITLTGEFGFAHVETATSYTAGDTLGQSVRIPGHNPGNIYFRARNANGEPLFAVSSGISAGYIRDGAEVFLPLRDAQGRVVLAPDPTNPASGIPFYEDVLFAGRPMNSQCNLPTNNTLAPGVCAQSRPSRSTSDIMRGAIGLEGDFGVGWNWRTNVQYSRYDLSTNGTPGVALINELNFALDGLGGPNCNRQTGQRGVGNCQYFNLFGNSTVATPGSAAANTQEVIDYVIPMLNDRYTSDLLTAEAILTGQLADLPAGPIGIAIGYQYREAGLAIDYDTQANIGNKANGVTQTDFSASRGTHAVFVETNFPLFDNSTGYLELNGALRREWIGSNLTTTDPKIGILFNTADQVLSLRGSYGTSFIAPSLFRLNARSARGAGVNDCPVSQGPPCTGELNLRIALIERGNPNLQPETSEAWSAGFTLRPVSGLTLEGTWWRFAFDNKIATLSPTDIVNRTPSGTPETPIVRDQTGRILSVSTTFINQASVLTEGLDFMADYMTAIGNMGSLNFNVAGTYNYKYNLQQAVGSPIIRAAGASNDSITGASPNTKLRINGRVTWEKGGHLATIGVRYYAPITFTLSPDIKLDAWYPVDISYTYNFDVGEREFMVGVGAQNVFNDLEPYVPPPGFQPFIPSLYDTRGRSIYAKASVKF